MAEESSITGDWFVGEDKVFPFTIYQKGADGVLTTTAQDITGWALRWDVRRSDSEADPPVLTKATGSGISITSGINGQGTVTIADTDTDALSPRTYRHALKRTDDGSETVLLFGNAVLGKRTTR
jgi:hypothetical protein